MCLISDSSESTCILQCSGREAGFEGLRFSGAMGSIVLTISWKIPEGNGHEDGKTIEVNGWFSCHVWLPETHLRVNDVLFDVDYVDLLANWNFYQVPSMMLKIKILSYSSWFYPILHTLYTHYVSPVWWLMLLVTSSWSHVKTIAVRNGYPIIALFHRVLSPDLAGRLSRLFLPFVGIPIMMPVPQIVWFSSRV